MWNVKRAGRARCVLPQNLLRRKYTSFLQYHRWWEVPPKLHKYTTTQHRSSLSQLINTYPTVL